MGWSDINFIYLLVSYMRPMGLEPITSPSILLQQRGRWEGGGGGGVGVERYYFQYDV
jgi:hypothetical protein